MADGPVLLTRPLEQSQAIASALEVYGIASLIWPLTRIVPTVNRLDVPEGTDGLLFTSANGVRAFVALSARRDLPALAVGAATAEAARSAGFADVRSAEGDVAALAKIARASGLGRFLHPCGAEIAGDLAGALGSAGIAVEQAVIYRAEETGPAPAPVADALTARRVAAVTAWSPRAAQILARRLEDFDLARTALVAISPAAASPLTDSGFAATRIAETPSREGMLGAIRAVFSSNSG